MDAVNKRAEVLVDYLSITLIVFCSCLVLFLADRETKGIIDLFTPQNLFALFLYAIPTTLLCFLLFWLLQRGFRKNVSYLITLTLGIPFGFMAMILLLSYMMGRL